jgi:hypothetical protein
MKKSVSIYVLLLVALCVTFSHVSWRHQDNGALLVVDEREIDIMGLAQERWVSLRRNCQAVAPIHPPSKQYRDIHALIQAYSPPGSESARIASLISTEAWALAEVQFEELLPAVVLIRQTEGELKIIPNAIWSGETHPWQAAPYIRHYMATRAPQAPAQLLDCFEPRSNGGFRTRPSQAL